jgi:TPR repeat protein
MVAVVLGGAVSIKHLISIGVVLSIFGSGCKPRSEEGLEKGCNEGKLDECVTLADHYELGDYVQIPKDSKKAVALYEKACTAGNSSGCYGLGLAYENGHGVEVNESKAFQLYQTGCNGDSLVACNKVGEFYAKGRTVPVDVTKAFAAFKKGCDLNQQFTFSLSACNSLGEMYRDGQGAAANPKLALDFFDHACHPAGHYTGARPGQEGRHGLKAACDNYTALEAQGKK